MIDLHAHILWGYDKGPRVMSESIQMVHMASVAGVTDIFVTPRVPYPYQQPDREEIAEKVRLLQEYADKHHMRIRLHVGAELDFHPDIGCILKGNMNDYCLGDSRYLLINMKYIEDIQQVDAVLALREAGFYPIMAHPERCLVMIEQPRGLLLLWQKGILIQSDIGSFAGLYGKDVKLFSRVLLEKNMVHFLGTNAQGVSAYGTQLQACREIIDDHCLNHDAWENCLANSQCVIQNEPFTQLISATRKSSLAFLADKVSHMLRT